MDPNSPGINFVKCAHEQIAHLCNLCDIKRSNFFTKKFWCSHRILFQQCGTCTNLPVFPPPSSAFPPLGDSKKGKQTINVRAAGPLPSQKSVKKVASQKSVTLLQCEHKQSAHLCKKCSVKAAIDCKCIHKKYPFKCSMCKGLPYSPDDLDAPEAFTDSDSDEGSTDPEVESMDLQPIISDTQSSEFQGVKTDNDSFQVVTRHKRRKSIPANRPPVPALNLSSKFNILQSDKSVEPLLTPPPIFISQIPNPFTFKAEVVDKISKNSKLKIINRTQFKIILEKIDEYRSLTKVLKDKKIAYFTYQIKEEKVTRVVCRGIPTDFPQAEETIRSCLEEKYKIPVKNVTRMLKFTDKSPLPLHYVDLLPFPGSNEMIWQVKEISNLIVKFEKPHQRKSVIQCKNCLSLGHSKSYCFRQPRCAICSEFHQTGECKTPDVPTCIFPVCALCKDNHLATYQGCKVKKEVSKKRFPVKSEPNQGNLNSNIRSSDKSYSSALKGPSSSENKTPQPAVSLTTTDNSVDYVTVINELKHLVTKQAEQIDKLMSVILKLLPQQEVQIPQSVQPSLQSDSLSVN
nr:PREDICTED: nucleic-acid-binding protein from mobile element jockey-like [Bemisia tabaci]XP_018915257.1 PREDICTED: nucleic-acid-binding protein from mobile element jockey-like [Bemisia tabaci]